MPPLLNLCGLEDPARSADTPALQDVAGSVGFPVQPRHLHARARGAMASEVEAKLLEGAGANARCEVREHARGTHASYATVPVGDRGSLVRETSPLGARPHGQARMGSPTRSVLPHGNPGYSGSPFGVRPHGHAVDPRSPQWGGRPNGHGGGPFVPPTPLPRARMHGAEHRARCALICTRSVLSEFPFITGPGPTFGA